MVVGRPFQKGQSGNPGGRPKIMAEVRELARHTPRKPLPALVKNLDDENGHVSNTAAIALLDRGYGKPPQAITGDSSLDPIRVMAMRMSFDELEENIARLDAEIHVLRARALPRPRIINGTAEPVHTGNGARASDEAG